MIIVTNSCRLFDGYYKISSSLSSFLDRSRYFYEICGNSATPNNDPGHSRMGINLAEQLSFVPRAQ